MASKLLTVLCITNGWGVKSWNSQGTMQNILCPFPLSYWHAQQCRLYVWHCEKATINGVQTQLWKIPVPTRTAAHESFISLAPESRNCSRLPHRLTLGPAEVPMLFLKALLFSFYLGLWQESAAFRAFSERRVAKCFLVYRFKPSPTIISTMSLLLGPRQWKLLQCLWGQEALGFVFPRCTEILRV